MIGVGLLGMTNYALIRDSPHTKDSNAMPIRVKSRGNETAEQMLRRFKKLCEREGITKDLKRRQYHEKPSEIKRREEIRGPQRTFTVRPDSDRGFGGGGGGGGGPRGRSAGGRTGGGARAGGGGRTGGGRTGGGARPSGGAGRSGGGRTGSGR
jgi:small subunit ribosomal protein S21